mmetsp:Transcript_22160/g.44830  ORF Transcript_22160/g.44830 Transcript_22160/m.44830 type:complete len:301 (+) Transcript_22160:101-1003(+)
MRSLAISNISNKSLTCSAGIPLVRSHSFARICQHPAELYVQRHQDRLKENDGLLFRKSSTQMHARLTPQNPSDDIIRKPAADVEMRQIEKEVMAKTQARLDMKRVMDALLLEKDEVTVNSSSEWAPKFREETSSEPVPSNPWAVAFAAGGATAALIFILTSSWIASGASFIITGLLASRDPLEEEGAFGSLARIIGRVTLKSIETTTPKARAVARAAVRGDSELDFLRSRVRQLECENQELRQWIDQRKTVDESLSLFSLDKLKDLARSQGIPHSGRTKAQLMMALIDKGALNLDQPSNS